MGTKQTSVTGVHKTSSRQLFFSGFWGITALEGVFCFFWFMRLPQSEAERALIFGYSLTRLMILLVFGGLVAYTIFNFIQSFVHPVKNRQLQNVIKGWFDRHDFLATGLLACLAVWGLLGLALEILLNPVWFPRSILYHFLYIRIRPIFLWTVLASVQTFILILANRWYPLRNAGHENSQSNMPVIWGAAVLVIGNLVLWVLNSALPGLFIDQNGLVLALIILLILVEAGLVAALHFRRA
ncbi:MAG: hypothetical protein AB9891_09850 [Anaerolineaceae bacterium]